MRAKSRCPQIRLRRPSSQSTTFRLCWCHCGRGRTQCLRRCSGSRQGAAPLNRGRGSTAKRSWINAAKACGRNENRGTGRWTAGRSTTSRGEGKKESVTTTVAMCERLIGSNNSSKRRHHRNETLRLNTAISSFLRRVLSLFINIVPVGTYT